MNVPAIVLRDVEALSLELSLQCVCLGEPRPRGGIREARGRLRGAVSVN
jgi:hypothetical protein